jgi:murein DD-endopeptidase MepM/ murein hydrolase activator NlpD
MLVEFHASGNASSVPDKIRSEQIIASDVQPGARLLSMELNRILSICLAVAVAVEFAPIGAVAGTAADGTVATQVTSKRGAPWSVQTTPARVVNGTPLLLLVTPPAALKSLSGTWLGHDLVFDRTTGKSWLVLAGVSLETKPGSYPLKVDAVTTAGKQIHFAQNLRVSLAKYPTVQLTVSKQFTAPSPEQQEKIKADQAVKQEAFSHVSPEREWTSSFAPPVSAEISDVFGTRRIFNGVTKSVHQGLDYRVPSSTLVGAVNRGTVILARPLYFEGNCVVIDHGRGLLSLYLHLSELKVKEGDLVERGALIGLSGATGRATGPHLHLAVRWQGVYLNPAVLLRLQVPDTESSSARTQ